MLQQEELAGRHLSPRAGTCQHVNTVRVIAAYVFHDYSALSNSPIAMSNTRDQTSRVDLKQRGRLLVWIDFDVLVIEALDLQCNPYSLYKRTVHLISISLKNDVTEAIPADGEVKSYAYQKQLPNSFNSWSFERLFAVAKASPLAFLW